MVQRVSTRISIAAVGDIMIGTDYPENRALNMIRGLSIEDFGNPGLTFHADGRITPAERPPVTRRTFPDDAP